MKMPSLRRALVLLNRFLPEDSKPFFLQARSSHWPTLRRHFLFDHPSCAACGTTKDLEVHHVKPFHLHPELELAESNLITLCEHGCHYLIGHLASWHSWNKNVREDAATFLQKIQERP